MVQNYQNGDKGWVPSFQLVMGSEKGWGGQSSSCFRAEASTGGCRRAALRTSAGTSRVHSSIVSVTLVSNSLRPHGLQPARLLCPWDSPGKNTGVGCHSFLQGIFPTQGSNPGLPHCRQILYRLSHQGSPSVEYVSHHTRNPRLLLKSTLWLMAGFKSTCGHRSRVSLQKTSSFLLRNHHFLRQDKPMRSRCWVLVGLKISFFCLSSPTL